jgi:NAD(P)-dependent dehydrogenase (short-subunit alcohol dehydrogenase family)
MLLKDQVALITGGGRGIGRAMARRFATEGARIVISARTAHELEATAKEIEASGTKTAHVVADVSREEGCEKIVRTAREVFGQVDILVNNAGIFGPVKMLEEVLPAEWDQVIAINLRGPFLLSRLVLPQMYQRGAGVILNISSISAKLALQLQAPYSASKAGLVGLTRSLAAEAARKGVRVNCLIPGPVAETSMSQYIGKELGARFKTDPAKLSAEFFERILQGRPQTADEIASAALFLVSNQASAITGQTLNVDGGMAFY